VTQTGPSDNAPAQSIASNSRDVTEQVQPEEALRRAHDELELRLQQRNAELVEANIALHAEIASRVRAETALRRLNVELENEAKRIASALHDGAAQTLTVAHIAVAEVERELPLVFRAQLQGVRRSLDEIEAQLRALSHELRPRVLEDLGLIGGLEFLTTSVARRTGIPIQLELSLVGRHDPVVETTIYRIVQQALTNIVKHSKATRAFVTFRQDERTITGSIRDDGVGFDAALLQARRGDPGLGLLGMHDRLEAVRGRLEIISAPGTGTELRITIPLEGGALCD
jgi:signal transduction histidine kinase